jgi:hypothetical protein
MTSLVQCKNRKVGIHDPRGSVWCQFCLHYTITDPDGRCQCCMSNLKNKPKGFPNLLHFGRISQNNLGVIFEYRKAPCPAELEPVWPVKIGLQKYNVPIHYFAEYLDLEDIDSAKKFIDRIKKECQVLPRYIRAVDEVK